MNENVASALAQAKVVWDFVDIWVLAYFGAFILYLLNNLNDKPPFSLFRGIKINLHDPVRPGRILSDMLISSAMGAFVVILLTQPETYPTAFSGGLGLTGLLSSVTK